MRQLTLLIIMSTLAGCRTHHLVPRLILQGEPVGNEFWLAAPYIAAVRMIRSDLQGPREPMFPGGPNSLQLIKFEAEVENQIRGDLGARTITFFFYANLETSPDYYLYPGRRYIVALRREGRVLRSWADATQLRIEIHSGVHSQRDLPVDQGPGVTIAYILLTPGSNCDFEGFANSLPAPVDAYAAPGYVKRRLELLQSHVNSSIRESACFTAASMFWYQPKCLVELSSSSDPRVREAAMSRLTDTDVDLKARLETNPFQFLPRDWSDYMWQRFEIFTEDRRPAVREAACALLKRLGRPQTATNCK